MFRNLRDDTRKEDVSCKVGRGRKVCREVMFVMTISPYVHMKAHISVCFGKLRLYIIEEPKFFAD